METKNEEIKEEEKINPSDIIFEEEDDADMPPAETAKYETPDENSQKFLKPTYKFNELFHDCLGKMPYASVLKNGKNEQIKLPDLMRFVEAKYDKMTITEMNTILAFVANCPLEFVRPLMEIVEDAKRQPELWTIL